MSLTPKLLQQGAAGSARPVYIEDVFSTFLYTGNSGTQTITNDIDLAGKGGLVWRKGRSAATSHGLIDTQRGIASLLNTNTQSAAVTGTNWIDSFNSNGFTMNVNSFNGGATYASWTFREQAKFFDIVTYTGNGTNPRNISHNLGSVPGCIIVKSTSAVGNWSVYHRGVSPINNNTLSLQSTAASSDGGQDLWGNGATVVVPTSTVFTVSNSLNTNGTTYVAYLFAHNAGGFGLTGNDNVISCGSFTTDGSGNFSVNLGYEPQWVLAKATNEAGSDWLMWDTMRQWQARESISRNYVTSRYLSPNTTGAEAGFGGPYVTNTGFGGVLVSSITYIYIAIRRGPMKVPTTGSSVFSRAIYTGNGGTQSITSNFPVDLAITDNRTRTSSGSTDFKDRLRTYSRSLSSNGPTFNFDEQDDSGGFGFVFFDRSTNVGMDTGPKTNDSGVSYVTRLFRRAPSFFDEVNYTGTGVPRTVTHNLSAVPELMIVKRREGTETGGTSGYWVTYVSALGNTNCVFFNTSDNIQGAGVWNNTTPTSSVFTVNNNYVNYSGDIYVAYLFASCPGVSKVGSYTGNGSTQTINCGFAAGARFVIIKRTSSPGGDWFTFDTARGIIAGNDPFLKFNTTTAEATAYDAVDPDSSGFIVNNDATDFPINVASATYIFLAIA